MFTSFVLTLPNASRRSRQEEKFWCPVSASDSGRASPRTPMWCRTYASCPTPISSPDSGRVPAPDPRVPKSIGSFPQPRDFISRTISDLLFLLPHYIHEGKSYLTIAFGCTGGQHRSVMIAEEVGKHLRRSGYSVKVAHRDSPK